jgi:hemerythrin superfamily protein
MAARKKGRSARRSNGAGRRRPASRRTAGRKAARQPSTILEHLKKEHGEVTGLLQKVLRAKDAEQRAELFEKMKTALVAHSKAEEELFYPLLEEDSKSKPDALKCYVEHGIVEQMLAELEEMEDKAGEEWTARCSVLKELVQHHAEEEERQIFKDARSVLGAGRLKELLPEFEEAEERQRGQEAAD